MRAWLTAFALTCAAGAAAASAMTGASDDQGRSRTSRSGDQCFNARLVTGFHPRGRDQVDVQLPGRQVYRLDLGAGCLDIDWALQIALRSRTGSFICSPLDAEIYAPSSFGRGSPPDRCLVTGIRRLSDAEVIESRRRRH